MSIFESFDLVYFFEFFEFWIHKTVLSLSLSVFGVNSFWVWVSKNEFRFEFAHPCYEEFGMKFCKFQKICNMILMKSHLELLIPSIDTTNPTLRFKETRSIISYFMDSIALDTFWQRVKITSSRKKNEHFPALVFVIQCASERINPIVIYRKWVNLVILWRHQHFEATAKFLFFTCIKVISQDKLNKHMII